MNIYNRTQIRAWDDYTISHEPVRSIDLMERAARKCCDWILAAFPRQQEFVFFCGTGNNGGDGLALARMLVQKNRLARVYLCGQGALSTDCRENLDRLKTLNIRVEEWGGVYDAPPPVQPGEWVVDALFGTGISRPLEGAMAVLIAYLNQLPNTIISIDMPSGLPPDSLAANNTVVNAAYTLTFQFPKFSFFLPEHDAYTGKWVVLDIGLHPAFEEAERTPYAYIDQALVDTFKPGERPRHSHKGNFGHALLMGGSAGMTGALVMAAKACLRSGAGLVSCGVHEAGLTIMQTAVPEAMCTQPSLWMNHAAYEGKTAVAAGMGWTTDDYHGRMLQWLISNVQAPLLIDASALNLLAANPEWLALRPRGAATILTPHIGEFTRLAGRAATGADRLQKAKELASQYQVLIILKGAYTQVVTPGGLVYFNSTGNPGMAKGGSGDVLAGLVTGLLAQRMVPIFACLLGVYLHGLAGDMAAKQLSQPGMTALDIAAYLPEAWKMIAGSPGGRQ